MHLGVTNQVGWIIRGVAGSPYVGIKSLNLSLLPVIVEFNYSETIQALLNLVKLTKLDSGSCLEFFLSFASSSDISKNAV
ncbi:hypothetical protein Csa_006790 [Cucumis sativus]|uniref:Uncharacterized protein n=1 Tax=Cucumis sativus TaxID=3659 RepID=A0A0A0LJL3_CUCSA|nr:hypothetical protein Csa_006790 [Cucumis sativus]